MYTYTALCVNYAAHSNYHLTLWNHLHRLYGGDSSSTLQLEMSSGELFVECPASQNQRLEVVRKMHYGLWDKPMHMTSLIHDTYYIYIA